MKHLPHSIATAAAALLLHFSSFAQSENIDLALLDPARLQNYQIDTTDYADYHLLIYNAENLFLNNRETDALLLYRSIFEAYRFSFAKDKVIAAQISAECGNLSSFLYFYEEALRSGVDKECVLQIPLIADFTEQNDLRGAITEAEIKQFRRRHLSEIDFKRKQKYVNNYRTEQKLKRENNIPAYKTVLLQNVQEIKEDTKSNGFPGEKRLGIDDKILTDERDVCQLSNETVLISLYHYPCSYTEFKDLLHAEILRGNLHPKDFAYLYEYEGELNRQQHNRFPDLCRPLPKDSVCVLIDWESPQDTTLFARANAQRRSFFVPPIEHDLRKKTYAEAKGMRLFFGFGVGFFGGHL